MAAKFKSGMGKEVKAHHILVLLLRLRQICSHPALIKSMLDPESRANEGLDGADGAEDIDLISQLSDMKIGGGDDQGDKNELPILDMKNPVFREQRGSSKITTLIEELRSLKAKGSYEKAVVVSQ